MIKIPTTTLQLAGYIFPSEDVVLTTPQTLSDAQKQQVRDNIGVSEALASKSDTTHTHTAADVGAYSTAEIDIALEGKSDTNHTHTAADVGAYSTAEIDSKITDINTALDGKSDTTHTHTAADVGAYTTAEIDRKVTELNDAIEAAGSGGTYGLVREFDYTPAAGTTPTEIDTSKIGIPTAHKAKLFLVEISNKPSTDATSYHSTTSMFDWGMRANNNTYYFDLGSGRIRCSLTVGKGEGSYEVKFTLQKIDGGGSPFISRVIGYR